MKIQSFIFTWNDYIENAIKIEKDLSKLSKTTVINSNINKKQPHWINLNDAYFSEQWNTLVKNIDNDCDFVFHVQSDIQYNNFNTLFDLFNNTILKYNIGVYAPDLDFTYHIYDIKKLKKYEEYLYSVPQTDETCWFINNKLIDKSPLFNPIVNKFGWGCDLYYIAKSLLNGYDVIRDYRIKINHPPGTNYNRHEAWQQFNIWINEQNENIKLKMIELIQQLDFYKINIS